MMALKRQRLDLIPILLQAGANTQYQSYSVSERKYNNTKTKTLLHTNCK